MKQWGLDTVLCGHPAGRLTFPAGGPRWVQTLKDETIAMLHGVRGGEVGR